MRSVNIPYLPAVDHVRAFAAVLVLAYHGVQLVEHFLRFGQEFRFGFPIAFDAVPMALLIEGHTAVGLFMVLTGFVLTYGALSHDVWYWPFLRNRLLRTYPLALFMLLLGLVMRPEQFSLGGLLQTLFGLANLPTALDVSPYSSMWWTVAVEWHFYVLFPWLLVFLKRRWAQGVVGLIGALLLLRWAMILTGSSPRNLSYLTIVGRLDQFLLGMLAAHLLATRPLSRRQSAVLTAGGLAATVVTLYVFNRAGSWLSDASWKIVWPTVEGLLWMVTLLGYLQLASRATGLWSRALCGVGTISYSIYLTHFVVLTLMIRQGWVIRAGDDTFSGALLTTLFLVLPITLAVSALTYTCIERPFLSMRGRYYGPERTGRPVEPAWPRVAPGTGD
jgi:peptidoglycan/LPS O-acetylase OafA/YrhL